MKAGGNINAHYTMTAEDLLSLRDEEEFTKYHSIFMPRSKWTSENPFDNLVEVSNAAASNLVSTLTPLMIAVLNDNTDVVNILLDFGADINIQSGEDKTALDYANEFFVNSKLKKSPAFEKLKAATTKTPNMKNDKSFEMADALVGQGKIPMYVRDKGKFIYHPEYFKIKIIGQNVNLRSQPDTKARIIDQLSEHNYDKWPSYIGEWIRPNGDRWVVGEYNIGSLETKTVWIFGKYAELLTAENYDLIVKQESPEHKGEELIEFVRNRMHYRDFSEELGYGSVGKQCEKFFSNVSWGLGTSGNKIFEKQCVFFKGVGQNVLTNRRYMFTIFFNKVAIDSPLYGLKKGNVIISQINQNDKIMYIFSRPNKAEAFRADITMYELTGNSLLSNSSSNANEFTLEDFLEKIYSID